MDLINYLDFSKIKLKVGEIVDVLDVENKDKLYHLKVDLNEGVFRDILAGIKQFYSKDELKGKKVVILSNLEPKKLAGINSNGMILAGSNIIQGEEVVSLIILDRDLPNGSEIF